MGRHHVKLPDHLYLSPPSPRPQTSAFASAAALLSLKTTSYPSPAALIEETSSTARAVSSRIPGFQASADSLRPTNLASSVASLPPKDRLHETTANSNYDREQDNDDNDYYNENDTGNEEMATDANSDFAPPSALNLPKTSLPEDAPNADAAQTKDPNEIPPLVTFVAEDESSRIEALRLVADSVAQQRQRMSRILIFHPVTIAVLVALFAGVYKYFYKGSNSDYAIIGTTMGGVITALLVSIRSLGGGYISEAERVGTWRWLGEGRSKAAEEATGKQALGQSDEIIVTKFGDEYVGAIVFRGVTAPSTSTKKGSGKKATTSSGSKITTEIRGWSVMLRYRRKGLGTALLEEAIKVASEKGWTSGGIDLADNHALSKRIMPQLFNGSLDKSDQRTRKYLQQKLKEFEESDSNKKGSRRRK